MCQNWIQNNLTILSRISTYALGHNRSSNVPVLRSMTQSNKLKRIVLLSRIIYLFSSIKVSSYSILALKYIFFYVLISSNMKLISRYIVILKFTWELSKIKFWFSIKFQITILWFRKRKYILKSIPVLKTKLGHNGWGEVSY